MRKFCQLLRRALRALSKHPNKVGCLFFGWSSRGFLPLAFLKKLDMPDLSSYINFSVRVEMGQSSPQIFLNDNSQYPSGVREGITGYFSIKSPDGGVDSGSWANPDVTWDGSQLTQKIFNARLNDKGLIQKGDYTITYNIDHPDYIPTVLSRTFNFQFDAPVLNLVERFDVFTPSLKYYDQTNYNVSGYTTGFTIKTWVANSIATGPLIGFDSIFDLAYSSEYYDAIYEIVFSSTVVYPNNTYPYLEVHNTIGKEFDAQANTPPAIQDLVGYLNDLKDELDENVNNCTLYEEYKKRYEYAASILFNILESCKVGLTMPLKKYVEEFLSITNNFVTPPYTNTNQIIEPYDCQCDTTTPSGSLILVDEFIIGDPGELPDGSTVYQNNDMVSKPIVFIDGVRVTYRVSFPGRHVTYNLGTKELTFSSPLNTGEVVSIYI
jgi:hypothetical protein